MSQMQEQTGSGAVVGKPGGHLPVEQHRATNQTTHLLTVWLFAFHLKHSPLSRNMTGCLWAGVYFLCALHWFGFNAYAWNYRTVYQTIFLMPSMVCMSPTLQLFYWPGLMQTTTILRFSRHKRVVWAAEQSDALESHVVWPWSTCREKVKKSILTLIFKTLTLTCHPAVGYIFKFVFMISLFQLTSVYPDYKIVCPCRYFPSSPSMLECILNPQHVPCQWMAESLEILEWNAGFASSNIFYPDISGIIELPLMFKSSPLFDLCVTVTYKVLSSKPSLLTVMAFC